MLRGVVVLVTDSTGREGVLKNLGSFGAGYIYGRQNGIKRI